MKNRIPRKLKKRQRKEAWDKFIKNPDDVMFELYFKHYVDRFKTKIETFAQFL